VVPKIFIHKRNTWREDGGGQWTDEGNRRNKAEKRPFALVGKVSRVRRIVLRVPAHEVVVKVR